MATTAAVGLSRERVATAAADLVDESGFDRLTLRGLAQRLGVSAPSLYEHVSSKDDLVDLVVAGVLDDAAAGWAPPAAWDDRLRYIARWWHRVLIEHECVYESVLRQPVAAPVALTTIELVIESLTGQGMTAGEAVDVYAQLFGYVMGATALIHARADGRRRRGVAAGEETRATEALLARLDPTRFPALVAARTPLSRLATEQAFEAGLAAIVDGVRARLSARPARRRRTPRRGR